MHWVFPLSLLILLEALADIFAKEWSLHGTWIRGAGSLLAYVIANMFWLIALRDGAGLARGAIIFSVASAILAVGIGLFLYKEQLTTTQIVGICIGVVAIALLFWE